MSSTEVSTQVTVNEPHGSEHDGSKIVIETEQLPPIWKELERDLKVKIPTHISHMLTLAGFDNYCSLMHLTLEDIDEVQDLARTSVRNIVPQHKFELYYGKLFKLQPEKFKFMPGNRKLLLAISDHLKSSKSRSRNRYKHIHQPTMLNSDSDREREVQSTYNFHPRIVSNDYEGDRTNAVVNLGKWLKDHEPNFKKDISMDDFDISQVSPSYMHSGNVVAVLKCKPCDVSINIQTGGSGHRWMLANVHRHLRRAHFTKLESESNNKSSSKPNNSKARSESPKSHSTSPVPPNHVVGKVEMTVNDEVMSYMTLLNANI